jgi:hypothetical protein
MVLRTPKPRFLTSQNQAAATLTPKPPNIYPLTTRSETAAPSNSNYESLIPN